MFKIIIPALVITYLLLRDIPIQLHIFILPFFILITLGAVVTHENRKNND